MTEKPTPNSSINKQLWSPIRTSTAADTIAAQVRGAILNGTLKAGTRLGSETELAAQFAVSRLTVRDALKKLESLGCVEIRVGSAGGTWVAGPNLTRFIDAAAVQLRLEGVTPQEMIQAQLAIECTTAELAAQNATDAEILRLRSLLSEAEAARDDATAFTELGITFHHAVAECAHNRVLAAQLHALRYVMQSNYAKGTTPQVTSRVLADHRRIVEVIASRDGILARQTMQEHLSGIRARACWACLPPNQTAASAS